MYATSSSVRIAAALLLFALHGGCRRGEEPVAPDARPGPAAASVLDDFTVRDGDPGLLFQYFSSDGAIHTAKTVADVPAAVRTNVVVLSTAFRKGDLPADQIILANLSQPDEQGNYSWRLVSRYELAGPAVPAKTAAKAPATDGEILLFSTSWCPHCRTAAGWLRARDLPFKEMDVEKDAAAQALLRKLGREEGIPDHMLSSVPILHVKGKLILGFNQQEIERLLR
jgi:glutaredoxin 3